MFEWRMVHLILEGGSSNFFRRVVRSIFLEAGISDFCGGLCACIWESETIIDVVLDKI